MRCREALLTLLLLATAEESSLARKSSELLPVTRASGTGSTMDAPTGWLANGLLRGAANDTVSYGDVGADGFSILDDVWDWDNPEGSDPLMGWYATDITEQPLAYGRRITTGIWDAHGNEVPAPILVGTGSLWIGAMEDEADALCWEGGLGYGNDWCQRAISPLISLSSAGDVTLTFRYFNDTEIDFDYTKLVLRRMPSGDEIPIEPPIEGLHGKIGLSANEIDPPIGADFVGEITAERLAGATQFQLIFEMDADGGWADDDGIYQTNYGPFGADDVVFGGAASASYDFETDAEGWTFESCPGVGSFMGVGNIAEYQILDPCGCEIYGNVLELHDDTERHPYGQREFARSNPTDLVDMRSNLPASPGHLQVIAEWDQYSELPLPTGAFYRPGWSYFPAECAATGELVWSGRVGQANYMYDPGPSCTRERNIATAVGVPQTAEQIRFIYEIYVSCDAFGITDCTFDANFTPIIDNVRVRGTKVPAAPVVAFWPGATTTRFQDGFGQVSSVLSPNDVGRADISYNADGPPGNEDPPILLGDSLYVTGPTSTPSTMWETRLWFKVRTEGPGTKPARYNDWKADVDAVNGNPNPTVAFAYAWMDSVQSFTGQPARNRFQSFAREDNFYPGEGGELTEGNEIIRDGVLVAGTAIDYFVTSNYAGTRDDNFLLPDTTGGFFFEFEILPSWRNDGGFKFPCLLYVDASDSQEAQNVIESAFAELELPHDRYDYGDASSNWKAPLARPTTGSNNGLPLGHLLGYRAIVVNTGVAEKPMWPEDFVLFWDWLTTTACDGGCRQGLILNGDNIATGLTTTAPIFLSSVLGATLTADAYHDGGDENYCVALETPLGGGHYYGTTNSHSPGGYEYDAWGNWCPQGFQFDVLGTVNGGVGNRSYVELGGGSTDFAQVAREVLGGGENYRVVLDGVSYHQLVTRDPEECVADSARTVSAVANELASALEWIFDGPDNVPSLCYPPCPHGGHCYLSSSPEVVSGSVTRLYQNSPNPFNPRTVIRFSLARSGPVELTIFDVNGRKVRALVNDTRDAGLHEIQWDGTDDAGHVVSSGVFWSQLETDGFTSNKKMVVLR